MKHCNSNWWTLPDWPMTEVATGVLHNVGNALNSVNVSVQLINDSLRTSRVTNLSKTVHLLRENLTADLLLNSDSRYWHLLDYLAALAEHLQGEQQQLYAEACQPRRSTTLSGLSVASKLMPSIAASTKPSHCHNCLMTPWRCTSPITMPSPSSATTIPFHYRY